MGKKNGTVRRTYVLPNKEEAEVFDAILSILAERNNCNKSAAMMHLYEHLLPTNEDFKHFARQLLLGQTTILSRMAAVCDLYAMGMNRQVLKKNGDKVLQLFLAVFAKKQRQINGTETDCPYLVEKFCGLAEEVILKKVKSPEVRAIVERLKPYPQCCNLPEILHVICDYWDIINGDTYTFCVLYAIAKILDEVQRGRGKTDTLNDIYDFIAALKEIE